MDVEIGQLLDNKYRILRLLGEGGMGAVYEGENIRIKHRVAIKVLHPSVAADSGARERFEREAQAAGQIGSDHICEVYDLGELPSGARYMVMEFLNGEPLAKRIATAGRLEPAVVAPMMLQFLDGLAAAHAAGIIHRDLKPDNVFLQRTKGGDFVKIVDFGISKFSQGSSQGMSMTRTGAVVGTPYYMSPEQVKGSKNIDHRSDIYSAGVVLFECVTGRVPFDGDTLAELIFKIGLGQPLDAEALVPGLDPAFNTIIRKSIARDPPDRYQSCAEFAQAITDWMQMANITIPAIHFGPSGMGLPTTTPIPTNTPIPGNTPMPLNNTPVPANNPGSPALTAGNLSTASGSVLTPSPPSPKRSGGMVFAVAGVAVVAVCAIGFGVMRSMGTGGKAETTTAVSLPTPSVTASAATTVPPPPAPTTAAPSAPATTTAPAPADDSAKAAAHPSASVAAGPTRHPVTGPVRTAKPSATPEKDTTTIKGRTIRTEL